MGFLDLKWDSNTTIVNLTSLLGGILAILATLVPNPLLNARPLGPGQAEYARPMPLLAHYRHPIRTVPARIDGLSQRNVS